MFDTVIMVDWSGGNRRPARPSKDAIWACVAGETPVYLRDRQRAEVWLTERIGAELAEGRRVLAGFDFPFGYPRGFARTLTGGDDPLALWDWFEARVEDGPDANNRFDLAGEINAGLPGVGPFWFNTLKRDIAHLPRRGRTREGHGMTEWRLAETRAKGSFSCWQMGGAGAVGGQVMTGLPVLARLRRRFGAAAWPFEPLEDAPLALVEIWPSLIDEAVREAQAEDEIRDAAQVRVLADAVASLPPVALDEMLEDTPPEAREEGWILGIGHEARLQAAARRL